jgi:hypothetical protein
MLWSKEKQYYEKDFGSEQELESAIVFAGKDLFGKNSIYLNVKKTLGKKYNRKSIPDGYLLDLNSKHNPKLYVVEVELATHDVISHISNQLLRINLSFEDDQLFVKKIIRDYIEQNEEDYQLCLNYLQNNNNFKNLDRVLDYVIYDKFCALVIIDKIMYNLDDIISTKFNFPIEIIPFKKFEDHNHNKLYEFNPWYSMPNNEDMLASDNIKREKDTAPVTHPDTLVVPGHQWGVEEVFLKEHKWYYLRIKASMIPYIKYLALYQTNPICAITHIAEIESFRFYSSLNKYEVYFKAPAWKVRPIKLSEKNRSQAPQGPRYTTLDKIKHAEGLDDVFDSSE